MSERILVKVVPSATVMAEVDLDDNDGALRSELTNRGWMPPEAKQRVIDATNERIAKIAEQEKEIAELHALRVKLEREIAALKSAKHASDWVFSDVDDDGFYPWGGENESPVLPETRVTVKHRNGNVLTMNAYAVTWFYGDAAGRPGDVVGWKLTEEGDDAKPASRKPEMTPTEALFVMYAEVDPADEQTAELSRRAYDILKAHGAAVRERHMKKEADDGNG